MGDRPYRAGVLRQGRSRRDLARGHPGRRTAGALALTTLSLKKRHGAWLICGDARQKRIEKRKCAEHSNEKLEVNAHTALEPFDCVARDPPPLGRESLG